MLAGAVGYIPYIAGRHDRAASARAEYLIFINIIFRATLTLDIAHGCPKGSCKWLIDKENRLLLRRAR
jgi:hypothetical protein